MTTSPKLARTILSGIQPTGVPHLGNYFGALRKWRDLSRSSGDGEDGNALRLFSIMDLHAITVPRAPAQLERDTFDCACALLACGIQPSQTCSLVVQSHVKQHLELYWVLQSISRIGSLKRMTQFKEKSKNEQDDVDLGLLAYPVLMAADILVYRAAQVPVGEDQLQHLEFARELAESFNRQFHCALFPKPQALVEQDTKRIMSLFEPSKKMSKSEERADSRIVLSDDADTIRRKIKRATTDSLGPVLASAMGWEEVKEKRRGVANLIQLMAASQNLAPEQCYSAECNAGLNMAQLKSRVADAVIALVDPIRTDLLRLQTADRAHVHSVLREGRARAEQEAEATMRLVRQAVGFLQI